jgi:hypothetical protein
VRTSSGDFGAPWETTDKVDSFLSDTVTSSDTATFYFNRGDTWTVNLTAEVVDIPVGLDGATITFDAYGTGDRPIFDGTDAAARAGKSWGIFNNGIDDTTFNNLHFKNVYASAIYAASKDAVTVDTVKVEQAGWQCVASYDSTNFTITSVECDSAGYHGASGPDPVESFGSGNPGCIGISPGGTYQGNTVTDCYGEGIHCGGSTCEYNVVGNSTGTGIYVDSHDNSVVRWNLIWGSTAANNDDKLHPNLFVDKYFPGPGIVLDTEIANATIDDTKVYGNIIIARGWGVGIRDYPHAGDTIPRIGSTGILIYQNTIISCGYLWRAYGNFDNASNPANDVTIQNNLSFCPTTDDSYCTYVYDISTTATWATINANHWDELHGDDADWVNGGDVVSNPNLGRGDNITWLDLGSAPATGQFAPVAQGNALDTFVAIAGYVTLLDDNVTLPATTGAIDASGVDYYYEGNSATPMDSGAIQLQLVPSGQIQNDGSFGGGVIIDGGASLEGD